MEQALISSREHVAFLQNCPKGENILSVSNQSFLFIMADGN